MAEERPLHHKQLKALELMLAGHSQRTVGKMVGSQRRTVAKWMKSPKFLEALEQARIERRGQAVAALDAAVPAAIARMIRVMNDPSARPSTQLRAANAILDRAGVVRVLSHEVTQKPDLVTLSPSEYAAAKVQEVRTDIEQFRAEGKATAIAGLHRLEGELMEAHTRAAQAEEDSARASVSDAEALSHLRDLVRGLPQGALDQLAELVNDCRKPIELKVVGSE